MAPAMAVQLCLLLAFAVSVAASGNTTDSCKSYHCGGGAVDVRYPFWVDGNGNGNGNSNSSHCGYAALRLQCRGDMAILHLPSGEYAVTRIAYSDKTVTLFDARATINSSCPHVAGRNLTLPPPLALTGRNSNLTFLLECRFSGSAPRYVIPCLHNHNGQTNTSSYLFQDVRDVPSEIAERCQEVVGMPVLHPAEDAVPALKAGFELSWSSPAAGGQCGGCEKSGGFCGQRRETFACFSSNTTSTSSGGPVLTALTITAIAVIVSILLISGIALYLIHSGKCQAHRLPTAADRGEGEAAAMVRKNGWQLPANKPQIIAITAFCLLVVGFYACFAPFLGKRVFSDVAISIYTIMALLVCILYIRCTSINPADPGIMSRFEGGFNNVPANNDGSGGISCFFLGGIVCALFVKEDCRKPDDSEQYDSGEEALSCTLCNAEVRNFTKHCRSCDKCVDGYDHHCEWLNNCVGRKNYFTFIALMAASFLWFAAEVVVGVTVFALCFSHQHSSRDIHEKFGNGFTRALFAVIVGTFTLLSSAACIPIVKLLFFHMILIRKGITTYDYFVAMRAMSDGSFTEDDGVVDSLSSSAATGFSAGSSTSLHHGGAWSAHPGTSVDQDEVSQHLDPRMVTSTVDPDAVGSAERAAKGKTPFKMSALSLAKMDREEVMKAVAKARASSSVLRITDARDSGSANVQAAGSSSSRARHSDD